MQSDRDLGIHLLLSEIPILRSGTRPYTEGLSPSTSAPAMFLRHNLEATYVISLSLSKTPPEPLDIICPHHCPLGHFAGTHWSKAEANALVF